MLTPALSRVCSMAPAVRMAFNRANFGAARPGGTASQPPAPVPPMSLDHLACFTPADLAGRTPPDLGAFRWKLLAQGDSWFSNARDKLNAHANLLQELVFRSNAAAVNCAGTGN